MNNLNSKKARRELIELIDQLNRIKNMKTNAVVNKDNSDGQYLWLQWAKLYTKLCKIITDNTPLDGDYRGVAETIIDRAERDPEEYKRKIFIK